MNQEEAPRDEAVNIVARSSQLAKYGEEATTQDVRWIRIEVTAVGRWSNADEKDADSARWRYANWIQQTGRTVHVDVGDLRIAARAGGDSGLKIRPTLSHAPGAMRRSSTRYLQESRAFRTVGTPRPL